MGEPQVRDQPEPALSDEVTAQLHAFSVRQARAILLAMAFVLVYFGAVLWLWFALPNLAGTYAPLYSSVPWLTLLAVVTFWHRRTPPVASMPMWSAAQRRLLATQSWRETPAKVLNTRGTVLVLPDGTAALPSGEPIPSMWVRSFVERLRAAYIAAILVAALSLILVLTPGTWWNVLTLASYLFVAVAIGLRFRYLTRLQATGTWTQAEATAPSWHARRNGLADGTVTLSFPDGRRFTVQLDRAPLDLFANVVREKSLWMAENRVVGFPHYPIVATARFTPVPA